ncbi:TonB family protein [Sphingorhabdus arenilitoris]|uniref:TonB family protein n=1 Tax=Sphingorhabdus arenilitoris TaxID=1490041 RepID=A0ABV8RKQ6_9SPHN
MSYVTQAQRGKSAGLTAAIAINGSIIAAIMLSPMVVPPKKMQPTITAVPVNAPQPPAPPPEKQQTETQPPIMPPIYAPKTIVPPLRPPIAGPTITDIMQADPAPSAGSLGEEPKIAAAEIPKVKPKTPVPVFRAAQRDSRFASRFQPDYPRGLLQREIEGNATVKVLIGTDGRVREAAVVSASHPDFGAATVKQALSSWRFKPATRDGQPVEDWQTLTVRFDITS